MSAARTAAHHKLLTPSQGDDRVVVAAGGAGVGARAAWGMPGALVWRCGERSCRGKQEVTFVGAAQDVCNMCAQGESSLHTTFRVTLRLGSE